MYRVVFDLVNDRFITIVSSRLEAEQTIQRVMIAYHAAGLTAGFDEDHNLIIRHDGLWVGRIYID